MAGAQIQAYHSYTFDNIDKSYHLCYNAMIHRKLPPINKQSPLMSDLGKSGVHTVYTMEGFVRTCGFSAHLIFVLCNSRSYSKTGPWILYSVATHAKRANARQESTNGR